MNEERKDNRENRKGRQSKRRGYSEEEGEEMTKRSQIKVTIAR